MLLLWIFALALSAAGVSLIAYSVVAAHTEPWKPLELVTTYISSLLTVCGTILTAAMIYLPVPADYRAMIVSQRYFAPAVIIGGAFAIFVLLKNRCLPQATVSGFGLLAIAGAIFRMLPKDLLNFPK